ncbi:MAG: D-alanine--D-alanine ligase [Aliivibrio sp.]|uniref:D-alanine--D-alanine ligase n=1 Tax=Aliivibrio sp. TaxID=1872443 RepID=UPI001A3FB032|nr:D-alanine--D-alanine ligase [Aliivibrio sp.]
MNKINVLLLCGGAGSEHEVSLVSSGFIEQQLGIIENLNVISVEIKDSGWFEHHTSLPCQFTVDGVLTIGDRKTSIDYAIPCIHGFPGETGDIQSLFAMSKTPYLGCDAQSSTNSFNKITSKLWYDALDIPNTPYLFLSENNTESIELAKSALTRWNKVFVKAACQGSSVGCYSVTNEEELLIAIDSAFTYSDQVLIELSVTPRELEVSAYEYKGELFVTKPGEISSPEGKFYTYEEKYSSDSHSTTTLEASGLSEEHLATIQHCAHKVFKQMKLKDLARIDFFLTEENTIYLNEVNTFPGMTPISMFPKLMEHNGLPFSEFLKSAIYRAVK